MSLVQRIKKKYWSKLLITIVGGGSIKKGIYVGFIVVLTIITTSIIVYFHPQREEMTATKKYFQIIETASTGATQLVSGLISNEKEETNNRDYEIDDQTLDKFINFYSNSSLEDLEIFEKEEARYILESMGYNNTIILRELLKDSKYNEEKIHKLLNENLFEEQIIKLNDLIK